MTALHSIPLSVFDLSPVTAGSDASQALRDTLALAREAEALGYRRFWVAEHHLAPGIASSAPAVLVALLAAATGTIRVGSAAILLGNYSPLSAADHFGTIARLHPGRVDLGLGRTAARAKDGEVPSRPKSQATENRVVDGLLIPPPPPPIGDPSRIARLARLLHTRAAEPGEYAAEVQAVLDFLGEGHQEDGATEPVHSAVAAGADLDVWVLGSSPGESARAAGALGLPFGANYHVAPSSVLETVAAYREAFRPSKHLAEPYVVVSADAVVAPTDAEARRLAAGYGPWVRSIRSGRGAIPYPDPEAAEAIAWTEADRAAVADRVQTQFAGSPERVADGLRTLQSATGADELLITTVTHDHADRVRSYRLLAEAWGQARPEPQGARA